MRCEILPEKKERERAWARVRAERPGGVWAFYDRYRRSEKERVEVVMETFPVPVNTQKQKQKINRLGAPARNFILIEQFS